MAREVRMPAAIAGAVLIAASLVLPATVGPVQGASAAPGSLQIAVLVNDPNGGYIGGTSKTYSGSYDCGVGFTGTFATVTTNTPLTIPGIPEGSACTVTASTPAGGLLNASFSWGTPTYSVQPVTIGDGTTERIEITHSVLQSFGTVELTKVVSGIGAYTGGTARVFPVGYNCTLTNGPTSNGTVNLTMAAPAQTAAIPVGSTCTFSETLTTLPGDFADPAAAWTGATFSPTSATVTGAGPVPVTVTNAYTGPSGQLVIANTVTGAGYIGTGAPFLYDYDCGVNSGQIAVAANSTGSATVPAGASCTVQQLAPSAALLASGRAWGALVWTTPTTATVANGGSVTLAVTNRIIAGLAVSGGGSPAGGLWLGLGMLVAGVTTLAIARRRGRTARRS